MPEWAAARDPDRQRQGRSKGRFRFAVSLPPHAREGALPLPGAARRPSPATSVPRRDVAPGSRSSSTVATFFELSQLRPRRRRTPRRRPGRTACRRSGAARRARAAGDAPAVGAVGGHRVEGVARRATIARAERDLLAGEAVRVAGAVPALVAGAHEPRDAAERGRGGDDALADQRVAADERPLVLVERPGLVEDRVGDRDLADVVQLGGVADAARPPRRRQAEPAGGRLGERRRRRRGGRTSSGVRSASARSEDVLALARRPTRAPPCFCAYMRWSAMRSASAASAASRGQRDDAVGAARW